MWEMSSPALARLNSSHGVGKYPSSAVWPLAGVYSDRPSHAIIAVVVVATSANVSRLGAIVRTLLLPLLSSLFSLLTTVSRFGATVGMLLLPPGLEQTI